MLTGAQPTALVALLPAQPASRRLWSIAYHGAPRFLISSTVLFGTTQTVRIDVPFHSILTTTAAWRWLYRSHFSHGKFLSGSVGSLLTQLGADCGPGNRSESQMTCPSGLVNSRECCQSRAPDPLYRKRYEEALPEHPLRGRPKSSSDVLDHGESWPEKRSTFQESSPGSRPNDNLM